MSAPLRPHSPSRNSSQYFATRPQVASQFAPTVHTFDASHTRRVGRDSDRSKQPSSTNQMQVYKRLVEVLVQYLMQEGFTFIEAYEQVLAVGRLNPLTTTRQIALNNPSIDQESFLEFKAYNACTRLKRRYNKVLAVMPA